MQNYSKSESGQAIVLIALSIVGVIALIALAIDGGNAYADRRQAQNAADAAALAAAMNYAQDQTVTDYYLNMLVVERTSSNGYNNTAPRSTVAYSKTLAGPNDCPVGSAGYFFQVDIDSYNPTWFAGVVGVSQVHNHVTSKAVGCAPHKEFAFDGNTIVVLHPTTCKAMIINGSFTLTITSDTNNGIYVNSNSTTNCPNGVNNGALYYQNGTTISPTVNVVGSIYGANLFQVPPTIINNPVDPIIRPYIWPPVVDLCGPAPTDATTVSKVGSNALNPGWYPGTNASWKNKAFPPAGITQLNPGVYCLTNDFKTTNTDTLTGNGVTFVMADGMVDIPGGTMQLSAPGTGLSKGLLFYVPQTNPNNGVPTKNVISISGNGSSLYTGSIVAPYGPVLLNGGGTTTTRFNCQVIAWMLQLTGSGILDLHYDKSQQWEAPLYAGVELVK